MTKLQRMVRHDPTGFHAFCVSSEYALDNLGELDNFGPGARQIDAQVIAILCRFTDDPAKEG